MDIRQIVPYENNPRHNDNAVKYLEESIKEFGFKNPIILDKNNVVIAGHTRLKAAERMNLDEVPVIIIDDLDDVDIKAFRLADNKVGEFSAWDFTRLENELEELEIDMQKFGFPDNEFDEDYLDDLFGEEEEVNQDEKVKKIQCPYCGEWFEP